MARFQDFARDRGLSENDEDTFLLYLTSRLKSGVAAKTIKGEASIIQERLPLLQVDPRIRRAALRGVERLADIPNAAKLPLLLKELQLLRYAIRDLPCLLTESESRHLRRRDWALYSLMFYGFLRVSEAVSLRWEHLILHWVDGAETFETAVGVTPARGSLKGLELRILVSKTDQAGEGQASRTPIS